MFSWLKRILGRQRPYENLPVPTNDDSNFTISFSGLEKQVSEIEQTLAGLTKISRRIHLSSDQNATLLKDIQSELKNHSKPAVEANNDHYIFTEQELLSLIDLSLSRSDSYQQSHTLEITQALLTKLGWDSIAEMDKHYHPTDCEIIEATEDTCEPGLVRHVIQQGYRNKQNQLIRRAKVIVTKPVDSLLVSFKPN